MKKELTPTLMFEEINRIFADSLDDETPGKIAARTLITQYGKMTKVDQIGYMDDMDVLLATSYSMMQDEPAWVSIYHRAGNAMIKAMSDKKQEESLDALLQSMTSDELDEFREKLEEMG